MVKKIEFIKQESGYKLFFNGIEVTESRVFESQLSHPKLTFYVQVNNSEKSQEMLSANLNDLASIEQLFLFPLIKFDSKVFLNVTVNLTEKKSKSGCPISFDLGGDGFAWNNSFSFVEYRKKFLSKISERSILKKATYSDEESSDQLFTSLIIKHPYLRFEKYFNFRKKTIAEETKEFIEEIVRIDSETYAELINNLSLSSINYVFSFPNDLKVYCEQYLLYFAKFLQDLGINATSNLKEEAGKVLFSVSPIDDIEALDKIREALAIYLNLPASPISEIEYSENFALMRLQQQVRNLQHSQQMAKTEILSTQYALRLAQQSIENQDKIIIQQNSFIDNQNKIIEKITSKSIMIDSLENKEELEEVYDGVKIGESKFLKEKLGVHLNPAKAIKTAVKNTFGKDEKKSVLGLDQGD